MKNAGIKFAWLFGLVLSLAFVLTGCPGVNDGAQDPTGTPTEETQTDGTKTDGTQTDDTTTSLKSEDEVTLNVGETKEVSVAGKTAAEFTQEGLTVTHKGDGVFVITAASTMTDATVNVNFNDGTETDEGIEVTVYVYDPYYHLTLTLDDTVKATAATISVAYGGVKKDEVSETVDATYTAGESKATAKLNKEYANSDNWFSPVKVTVKDSDGKEVVTNQSVAYFCYTAVSGDGYIENNTIALTAGVAVLTFTIKFEGFTIAGGSVSDIVYTKVENDFETEGDNATAATVTVAEDGTSATFTVKKAYTNDTGWFQVNFADAEVKDSSSNAQEISTGNNTDWFEYKDGMSVTFAYSAITDDDYTETLVSAQPLPSDVANSVCIVKSDLTIPDDAKAFKLVYTKSTADSLDTNTWITIYSDSNWTNETKLVNAWEVGYDSSASTFTYYITDSAAVSAFKAGNFYVKANSAYTGTITITYAK